MNGNHSKFVPIDFAKLTLYSLENSFEWKPPYPYFIVVGLSPLYSLENSFEWKLRCEAVS